MAKEVTCKVLKVYCETDETEYGNTKLAEISWNNRPCTSVDIRKWDKGRDAMFKGISVSYDGLADIVASAIENGLVPIERVEEALAKRKKIVYSDDDFKKLFKKMESENQKYTRDRYGHLRDNNGHLVIASRRKK